MSFFSNLVKTYILHPRQNYCVDITNRMIKTRNGRTVGRKTAKITRIPGDFSVPGDSLEQAPERYSRPLMTQRVTTRTAHPINMPSWCTFWPPSLTTMTAPAVRPLQRWQVRTGTFQVTTIYRDSKVGIRKRRDCLVHEKPHLRTQRPFFVPAPNSKQCKHNLRLRLPLLTNMCSDPDTQNSHPRPSRLPTRTLFLCQSLPSLLRSTRPSAILARSPAQKRHLPFKSVLILDRDRTPCSQTMFTEVRQCHRLTEPTLSVESTTEKTKLRKKNFDLKKKIIKNNIILCHWQE